MIPQINKYYTPYNDCPEVKKLIREDSAFWYFDDGVKHPKSLSFKWIEVEKPITSEDTKVLYTYESYSEWAKTIAKTKTVKEIENIIHNCEMLTERYANQHLRAIQSTTSMTSQSQRRAQTRNNVVGNYEEKQAHINALEIKKHYPEKC